MNPLASMLFGSKQGPVSAPERSAGECAGNGSTAPMGQIGPNAGVPGGMPANGYGNPVAMMNALRANPGEMLRGAGYNVPEEMAGNPQGMVMHLIQSGQVSGPMMQRIQPMLQRMGFR